MPRAGSGEQLSLAIETAAATSRLPLVRARRPMVGDAPFDDAEWFFEPWWPGTTAIAYVEGGETHLQIEHLADPAAAFPELRSTAAQFAADQLIVEGALLVLDDEGRPDAELLRRRLAEPGQPAGTPALVCSDLLHSGERSLLGLPFEERRAMLARLLHDGDRCVVSRGLVGEGMTLAEAVASMGLNEISARLLSGRYRPGVTDEAWLRLPVTETPAEQTRPLLALLQRLPL